jgi:hypothetical protein
MMKSMHTLPQDTVQEHESSWYINRGEQFFNPVNVLYACVPIGPEDQ